WTQEARELEAALGNRPAADPDPRLDRDGDDPEAIAARVRLDLRCDRLDHAAARLAALAPELRERLPAERAALALIRGDAAEAIVRTTHHRGEPRLAYLRARALMLLGEHSEAGQLLDRARVALPRSVTIKLALALARHHEAPDSFGEAFERRFEELLDWAPGLLSDAAGELDIELWTDQG